jgi:hypothetical protein
MEYKKDACLMIDPRTGAARLVEPSEDPEKIVKGFLKQIKKPHSLIWAMDQLAYEDWQKWEPVRKGLWDMLEELDKLGY